MFMEHSIVVMIWLVLAQLDALLIQKSNQGTSLTVKTLPNACSVLIDNEIVAETALGSMPEEDYKTSAFELDMKLCRLCRTLVLGKDWLTTFMLR